MFERVGGSRRAVFARAMRGPRPGSGDRPGPSFVRDVYPVVLDGMYLPGAVDVAAPGDV
ncbi:MAG TPA: hypothetical protein VNN07_00660 [Candidatus Tectomicrobia bacterium]|nr:hypothetical protein [Candidatus Tectomicrobia bacterium]